MLSSTQTKNIDCEKRWWFNYPTRIRFGKGSSEELSSYIQGQNIKRPLIVTDGQLREMGFMKKILGHLQAHKISPYLYSDIHKNPIKSDVLRGAEVFITEKCDAVIGIGGGASMDVARAICLAAYHPNDLFSYCDGVGDHLITEKIPPFITVPTTSGTGSEVGRSAIISDDETHEKKILFSPRLLAQIVFADPELTMELPATVTAATGMDAFTHNIEAYLARGYHPMAEGIALEGMRLIASSIRQATLRPDLWSRTQMMMGSLMGAVAFQKGLGVVHSLAHPLSILFDMHHGLANAIMIPYGMSFNKNVCAEKIQRIQRELQCLEDFISYLQNLNQELGILSQLSSYALKKIEQEHLGPLAHLAFLDFCHPSNPRSVTEADFLRLYQAAWNGKIDEF